MTDCLDAYEQQIEDESRDDYSEVVMEIGDGWRLILANLSGATEIVLQCREGEDEWVRFLRQSVKDMNIDLREEIRRHRRFYDS